MRCCWWWCLFCSWIWFYWSWWWCFCFAVDNDYIDENDGDVCFAVDDDYVDADDDVFCRTPLGSLHYGPPLSAPPPQDPTKKIFACHHWFIRHKHAHQNLLKNYQKCACFNFIDNTTKTIPNPKCLNFRTVNATNVSAFVMDIKLMLILRSPKVSHLVS